MRVQRRSCVIEVREKYECDGEQHGAAEDGEERGGAPGVGGGATETGGV